MKRIKFIDIPNISLKFKLMLLAAILFGSVSCKKLLEIDSPIGSIEKSTVFKDDSQALAALNGLYSYLASSSSYASGGASSISFFAGMSADELVGHNSYKPFSDNNLTPQQQNYYSAYLSPYSAIYRANSILEGVGESFGITPNVKAQIEGESKFIRAFSYFYLVNLFGPVPLNLSSDYRRNLKLIRSSESVIYDQIIFDLQDAERLLQENYPVGGRYRVSKAAVQSLLARVYLYIKDWDRAERYATDVINNPNYKLVGIDEVFLVESEEAIWQLKSSDVYINNTQDGALYVPFLTDLPPSVVSLDKDLGENSFEINDKRRTAWIGNYNVGSEVYHFPNKYKVTSSSAVTEASMVFRLAEQYLIRAEARINKSNLIEGLTDLNMVRQRRISGVISNPIDPIAFSINKTRALLAVENERRLELFSEWGHRWFDLKRTNRATIVKQIPSKALLYPIPFEEITANGNITQNMGY